MWPRCVPWARERRRKQCSGTGKTPSPSTTIPKNIGLHLRTSNPIDSIFSGVGLRTNAARRLRCRDNALYMMFKIVQRLSGNRRALNGGANLMALVLAGYHFKGGKLQRGFDQSSFLSSDTPKGLRYTGPIPLEPAGRAGIP